MGNDDFPTNVVIQDEGLRCLRCKYNLTGLTKEVCPECGMIIDWQAAKEHRDAMQWGTVPRMFSYWEHWPWFAKPLGFLATAAEAAFLPWRFARKVPPLPRQDWAWGFAGLCFACVIPVLLLPMKLAVAPEYIVPLGIWAIGIAAHIYLQSALYSSFFNTPPLIGNPYSLRFWRGLSCYTTWPVILEGIYFSLISQLTSYPSILNTPYPLILIYGWWILTLVIMVAALASNGQRLQGLWILFLVPVTHFLILIFLLLPVGCIVGIAEFLL